MKLARVDPMEIFDFVLQRWIVITLAVLGGAIAILGSLLSRKNSKVAPRLAKRITRFGYLVTWVSVGIFIVIGFRGS